MTSVASLRTHTDAIVSALAGAGLVVGDATDPADPHGWTGAAGTSQFIPYVIVYPISGGEFDGTLANHSDDADLIWQLTCVGAIRAQVEHIADSALAALVAQPLTVAGRSISKVWPDLAGAGVRRDDTAAGVPLYLSTPRIRVKSYPA
jgi:hypothetical protein